MSNLRKVIFVFLLSVIALLGFTACVPKQPYSSIPQSRPADWEGRIPGMGQ